MISTATKNKQVQLPSILILSVPITNPIILQEWIRRIRNPHRLFQKKTQMLTRSDTLFHPTHRTLIWIVIVMTRNLMGFYQGRGNHQREAYQVSKEKNTKWYNEFEPRRTITITRDIRWGKITHIGDNTDKKIQFGNRLEEICGTWIKNGVERAHTTSRHANICTNLWKRPDK